VLETFSPRSRLFFHFAVALFRDGPGQKLGEALLGLVSRPDGRLSADSPQAILPLVWWRPGDGEVSRALASIATNPGRHPIARVFAAVAVLIRNDHPESRTRAIEMAIERPGLEPLFAQVLIRSGDVETARQLLLSCPTVNLPFDILVAQAATFCHVGEPGRADELIEKVSRQVDRADDDGLSHLAVLHLMRGRPQAAWDLLAPSVRRPAPEPSPQVLQAVALTGRSETWLLDRLALLVQTGAEPSVRDAAWDALLELVDRLPQPPGAGSGIVAATGPQCAR
jgi:hypothetical protein